MSLVSCGQICKPGSTAMYNIHPTQFGGRRTPPHIERARSALFFLFGETTPHNFSYLSINSHSQPSNDIHSLALSDNN